MQSVLVLSLRKRVCASCKFDLVAGFCALYDDGAGMRVKMRNSLFICNVISCLSVFYELINHTAGAFIYFLCADAVCRALYQAKRPLEKAIVVKFNARSRLEAVAIRDAVFLIFGAKFVPVFGKCAKYRRAFFRLQAIARREVFYRINIGF